MTVARWNWLRRMCDGSDGKSAIIAGLWVRPGESGAHSSQKQGGIPAYAEMMAQERDNARPARRSVAAAVILVLRLAGVELLLALIGVEQLLLSACPLHDDGA